MVVGLVEAINKVFEPVPPGALRLSVQLSRLALVIEGVEAGRVKPRHGRWSHIVRRLELEAPALGKVKVKGFDYRVRVERRSKRYYLVLIRE